MADQNDAKSEKHIKDDVTPALATDDGTDEIVQDEWNGHLHNRHVDLSKFEPKYNTHTSALPTVLTDYGLQGHRKKKTNKAKLANEKKKARQKDVFIPDIDMERQRIREEHHMEVYEDVHKLRDFYYEEYMEALRDKIRRQKDAIQKKSEALESRLRKNEYLKKERSKQLKSRIVRHNVSHDESFLKGIPKSQFYKIVSLHDKLLSEGKLKTQTDKDAFWKNIRKPDVYKKQFGSESGESVTTLMSSMQQGFTASSSSYQSTGQSTGQPTDSMGPRQLTQITESKESSRPVTREAAWAVSHHNKPPAKLPADPYVIAKQAAIALDKKCPQVPLPAMSCFTMELGEKPPDPNVLREQAEALSREKERRRFVKTLRKMYHLSLAHAASTTRILNKHKEDFALALEGPDVNDLGIYDMSLIEAEEDGAEPEYSGQDSWRQYLRPKTDVSVEEEEEEEERQSRQNSAPAAPRSAHSSRQSSSKSKPSAPRSASSAQQIKPLPLTLDGITREDSVLEAKCLSTFWTNHAGRWMGHNYQHHKTAST